MKTLIPLIALLAATCAAAPSQVQTPVPQEQDAPSVVERAPFAGAGARAPRSPRLRIVQEADSIVAVLSWGPAPPAARGSLPTGYEWQLAHGVTSALVDAFGPLSDSLAVVTGTTPADVRAATATVMQPCGDGSITDYHLRARARGTNSAWEGPGAWGATERIDIVCSSAPAGPPDVQLDTLAVDTLALETADSVKMMMMPVVKDGKPLIYQDEAGEYRGRALGRIATVCAISFRGDEKLAVPEGSYPIGFPESEILTGTKDGFEGVECYNLVAVANGHAEEGIILDRDWSASTGFGFGLALASATLLWFAARPKKP